VWAAGRRRQQEGNTLAPMEKTDALAPLMEASEKHPRAHGEDYGRTVKIRGKGG